MSKKSKRLEKDNDGLRRQKEATAGNILRMAEERQEWKKKADGVEKKNAKLMSIIQQMQHQGRKLPSNMTNPVEGRFNVARRNEGGTGVGAGAGAAACDESDYSGDGDEGEPSDFGAEGGEDEEDDDDTEDEPQSPAGPSSGIGLSHQVQPSASITRGGTRLPALNGH